jgi:hypothetical protein
LVGNKTMAAQEDEPRYLRSNIVWPTCRICYEPYSSERIPVLLLCCEITLCLNCFEQDQASKLAQLDENDIRYGCPWSGCPLSKNTGYNRSGKCYAKNRALMDILGIDTASSTAVNPSENIAPPNNNGSANPNVVSPTAAGRVNEEDDIGNEIIDLSHDNDSPDSDRPHTSTGANLRRSQRTRRPAQRNLEDDTAISDEPQTSNDEFGTNSRRSKRQRRVAQSQPADDADERVSERSRIVNRRIDGNDECDERGISANVPISISSPDEVAANELWKEVISKEGVNVYRIRCYMTESKTHDDKYARRMSEWCVNNGMTITCLELAKTLPRHQWFDAEALRNRVVSVSHQELRRMCSESQHLSREEGPYIRSYKQFVEMKKGVIVVLHTKGDMSGGRGPPQTLSFGVIQDDSLSVMSREEAMMHKQCPWDPTPAAGIGFMVRKVIWLRQGELRAARGPHQVNWLAEFSPLWLMQVGERQEQFLRDAIRKMGSERFIRNTHSIDNQWTMG